MAGQVEELQAALEAARRILASLGPLTITGSVNDMAAYRKAWADAHSMVHPTGPAPQKPGKHSTGWQDSPSSKSGF